MKNVKKYILVAVVIIAGLMGWVVLSKNGDTKVQTPSPSPIASSTQNTTDKNAPTLGDEKAPVTIVEYGHFKCPFCNRFFRETEPQIAEKYIKTGKVKFVWKDFPYEGGDAVAASETAYCAQDQGKFWEYHDLLFTYIWDNYYSKNLNVEDESIFTNVKLKELAGQLGLDSTKFDSCVDSGKYSKLVQDNYNEGITLGAKSTPTFFINGQKVVGAQPFSVFSQIIDSQLK